MPELVFRNKNTHIKTRHITVPVTEGQDITGVIAQYAEMGFDLDEKTEPSQVVPFTDPAQVAASEAPKPPRKSTAKKAAKKTAARSTQPPAAPDTEPPADPTPEPPAEPVDNTHQEI